MSFPNPFWSRQEKRPRALWRLILQAIVLVVGLFALNALIGIAFLASMVNDPAFQRALADPSRRPAAIAEAAAASGWYEPVSSFAFLLAIALSLWLAAVVWDRRPFRDFGFHFDGRWWRDFGFGLGLGALLLTVVFLIELAAGWITVRGTFSVASVGQSFLPAVLLALLNFVFVGIREEMLSRGYQLRNLAEGLSWPSWTPRVALLLGWFVSSAIFGLLHAFNPNASPISTVDLVLAGLLLGFGFILTGELAIPIGLHITWNFFEGNVYGFPVSGLTGMPSFLAIEQRGPDLWTGGAFGPEAGLLNVVTTVLGLALIWLWVRQTRGQAVLQERLAEYRRSGLSPSPSLDKH